MKIQTAETDEQVAACDPVMLELRPHLDADAFVGIVRDMAREDAHRFYEANNLLVSGYHFRIDLDPRVPWSR